MSNETICIVCLIKAVTLICTEGRIQGISRVLCTEIILPETKPYVIVEIIKICVYFLFRVRCGREADTFFYPPSE